MSLSTIVKRSHSLTDSALLEHLLAISRNMAEIRDAPTLLRYTVEEVMNLVGAEWGYMVLVGSEQGYVILVDEQRRIRCGWMDPLKLDCKDSEFQIDWKDDKAGDIPSIDQDSRNIVAEVLDQRTALLLSDASPVDLLDAAECGRALSQRSAMCVPLISQNELLGAIYVESGSMEGRFSKRDLKTLEYFRPQAAAAVVQMRLDAEYHRLQERYYQAQKLESLGRLSSSIAHDFNNLIAPIVMYADLGMRRVSTDDKLHTYLSNIRYSAKRASKLTSEILDYSRDHAPEKELVDLNGLLDGFANLAKHSINTNIVVTIQRSPDSWMISANRNQIERVLLNLVVNANDAMPSGGTLVFKVCNYQLKWWNYAANEEKFFGGNPPTNNYVVLSISDSGTGMDSETREHIFDPFFTTKDKYGGTGLGLATVFSIVKQHNGYISTLSAVDQGTTFRLYFPRHKN